MGHISGSSSNSVIVLFFIALVPNLGVAKASHGTVSLLDFKGYKKAFY